MPSTLVLFAAIALQAQNPAAQGTVAGRVIDAASKQPIEGAAVYVFQSQAPNDADKVQTDTNGNFRITGLRPGTYRLGAEKTGFLGRRKGLLSNLGETKPIEVRAGETIENLIVRMRRGATLAGRVLGESGEPLAGVLVTAISKTLADPKNGWGPSSRTRTKANGTYSFTALESDSYWIVVFPPLPSASPGYPRTIYPNAESLNEAQPVYVSEGDAKQNIDFHLRRVPFFEISGVYKYGKGSFPGLPMKAQLRGEPVLEGLGLDEVYHADLLSDGTFQFRGIRPGNYRIEILDLHRSRDYVSKDVELGLASLRDIQVEPRPYCSLPGKLMLEGQGAKLTSIDLIFQPEETWLESKTQSAKIDTKGSFLLAAIRPGNYYIDLSDSSANYYAKSIRFAGLDPTRSLVNVSCENGSLELVLSRSIAYVSGQVKLAAKLASDGVVIFRPIRAFHSRSHTLIGTRIDSSGSFAQERLAPGTYLAYAFEATDFGLARDESLLQKLRSKATAFKVEANETKTIEITLITASEFEAAKRLP